MIRVAFAAALAAVGLGLLAGALLRGTDARLPAFNGITARATLAPGPHHFGDPVAGAVDVMIEGGVADPAQVSLVLDPFPYRVAKPAHLRRYRDGADTLLRFEVELECLDDFCLPGPKGDDLLLANGLVFYTGADGRRHRLLVGLPVVRVVPRALPVGLSQWADGLRGLEAPGTVTRPWLVGGLLGLLALAAVGLALGLARAWLGTVVRFARRDRRSPLRRALSRVRRAASGDDVTERRLALDGLALALDDRPLEIRARTERLAWGPEAPAADPMVALADDVGRRR